jgi:hypothetical protein
MACGGLPQGRQPRGARAFLHFGTGGQAKAQAFPGNAGLGQKPHDVVRLIPAFRAHPMIRHQRHNGAAPRRHPIPRQQGERQAMRPARNRDRKPWRRAEWPKRRHAGGEFGAADRRA